MTDFSKILEKAKELEKKMKESQEAIKKIEVIGTSGGDLVKVKLNGEGEVISIEISDKLLKEESCPVAPTVIRNIDTNQAGSTIE